MKFKTYTLISSIPRNPHPTLFHCPGQYSNIKCIHQGKKKRVGERIWAAWIRGNKTTTLSLLEGSGLDFIKRRWSDERNKSSLFGVEGKSKISHSEWCCLTERLMKLIYTVESVHVLHFCLNIDFKSSVSPQNDMNSCGCAVSISFSFKMYWHFCQSSNKDSYSNINIRENAVIRFTFFHVSS